MATLQQQRRWGRRGGKTAARNMTPEARTARARKAGLGRVAQRKRAEAARLAATFQHALVRLGRVTRGGSE